MIKRVLRRLMKGTYWILKKRVVGCWKLETDGNGSREDECREVMAQHYQVSHSPYTLYNAPQPSQPWHFPLIFPAVFPVLHANTLCCTIYWSSKVTTVTTTLTASAIFHAASCPTSMPAHPALHHTLRGSSCQGWVSLCCLCTRVKICYVACPSICQAGLCL